MLVWDPQEGYDHVLNGVRHHFDSILQRKRKNRYAVTALRRLFTLPCHLQYRYVRWLEVGLSPVRGPTEDPRQGNLLIL